MLVGVPGDTLASPSCLSIGRPPGAAVRRGSALAGGPSPGRRCNAALVRIQADRPGHGRGTGRELDDALDPARQRLGLRLRGGHHAPTLAQHRGLLSDAVLPLR